MTQQSSPLRVDMISESEFTVQGHGVHTAYVEMRDSLRQLPKEVDIKTNTAGKFDIVHVHTVGLYSLWRLLFSGRRRVVSAHVVPDSFIGSLKGARVWRPLAKWWLRFFYNRADLVLAVSTYTKAELQKLGVKRRIEVLYNTIDTKKYHTSPQLKKAARQSLGIDQDAFVVISSGQVQPRKRVDVMAAIARRLPDTTVIWVGGVPFGAVAADNRSMQHMMNHPPQNMMFTGVVPLEAMVDYYRAADVFVLPSEQETFGLVVVEAAAAGLPVVLRDIHDYDDTFRGGAVMAEADDDFIRAVQRLRDDAELYAQQQTAAGRIAQRFDSKAGAERLLTLYRELLES
ncbi:MAG: glycosyltransferase [Candidatus Saccharibacteria bacterium]|nr:glycosyltransferase [Candidatus Saccharibacteria bacterium]